MEKQIMNFSNTTNWQVRERDFKLFQETYGDGNAAYSIFKFTSTRTFEKGHSGLNTKKEFLYVCKGNLERLLEDLEIYDFDKNEVLDGNENILKLKLIQTRFPDHILRQPKKRIIEGCFYQVTEEEFQKIPFKSEPITSRRDIFLATKLNDSVAANEVLNQHFSTHFSPIKANEKSNDKIKYRPMLKERTKGDVPNSINQKAFELAAENDLNEMEFNFLNYFYETRKPLLNGEGQSYFDIRHNGSTFHNDRKWVRKHMQRLIDLGFVKLEIRRDCEDGRVTNWYFYDANRKLDHLLFLTNK